MDDITSGKEDWIKVLEQFWYDFNKNVLLVKEKRTREVLDLLNELVNVIDEELQKGNKVRYSGIGTFFTKKRASSQGRNPQTGEPLSLESRIVPRFQFSERLKRSTK